MKTVYIAQHSIDAHVVRGLLESHGISAIVFGDYLQGGMGELPAFGVIEVRVDDEEEQAARRIVTSFESGEDPEGQFEA